MHYQRHYSDQNTLSKDPVNKKLSGVCAGVARHLDIPRWVVRLGAIFALFSVPMMTGVAYVVATLVLSNRKSSR